MKSIPQEITTISQLQACGFGQPWPRHGLQLLFWFAKDCITDDDDDDDDEMFLEFDLMEENFGFHLFENRDNKHNGKLLPDVNFQYYYLVGNLNSPGADMLPEYIHEHNTGQRDGNTDRIIVTDHGERKFGKIYVTTHKDKWSFDPDGTFHITRSLLKTIRLFPNLDKFLLTIGYQKPVFQMVMLSLTDTELAAYHEDKEETYDVSADTDTPSRNCICSCTIL